MHFSKYPFDRKNYGVSLLRFPARDVKSIEFANKILGLINFEKPHWGLECSKYLIPTIDSRTIPIYIYKRKGLKGQLPVLIYYHGGGFFLKGTLATKRMVEAYAKKLDLAVVYVDYRLSIEMPYPYPLEDCYSALKWIYSNGKSLGLNRDKIIVSGFSAGGALAASTCILARDRKGPEILCQILKSPVTDSSQNTPSVKNFVDTPIWDREVNKLMWDIYLSKDSDNKYASPLGIDNLENLPSAYVEVAEFDPLHDEGVIYAHKLLSNGVQTKLIDTKGTIHNYPLDITSPQGKKSFKNEINTIIKVLGIS